MGLIGCALHCTVCTVCSICTVCTVWAVLLQVFIDSEYKLLGRPTTEEECAGLLTAALFAGQHTSSLTATWIAAYLSK